MLSRKYRLPIHTELEALKQSGKRHSSPILTLAIKPNNFSHPRLGIIISTKISRSAVTRNRLKRRLFSAVKPWLKANPDQSLDILILPTKKSLNQPVYDLQTTITLLLNRQ